MMLRASHSTDTSSGKYRHTAGRTALSVLLTFVLAISMLPILPSNPLGDHSVPAYAYDSTVDELSIDDYILDNVAFDSASDGNSVAEDMTLVDTGERIEAISLLVIADNIKPDETFDSMFADPA